MSNPTRRDDVFATSIDDQLLLHDTATQQTHCLNALARRVWELCDGTRDRDAIVRALAAESLAPARAADVVDAALDNFTDRQLLAGGRRLDRRAVGAGMAKAIAAGLVVSIVTPNRAAAASASSCSSYTDRTTCNSIPGCRWVIGEFCDSAPPPPP